MDALLTAATSGLRARLESLDMLANNLANASTAGYKADREFYSTYIAAEAFEGPQGTYPAASPVVEENWIDLEQGALVSSAGRLDVGLNGPGFFVVDGPQGMTLLTRGGQFGLRPDGTVVSADDRPVRGVNGRPIQLNPALDIEIDRDGSIRQQGQIVNRFEIVLPEQKQALSKVGATYFQYDGPAPGRPGGTTVEQGKIESANFQPAEAAIRLVDVMRQFEMLQKAITLGAEMNRRAAEDVARVS